MGYANRVVALYTGISSAEAQKIDELVKNQALRSRAAWLYALVQKELGRIERLEERRKIKRRQAK